MDNIILYIIAGAVIGTILGHMIYFSIPRKNMNDIIIDGLLDRILKLETDAIQRNVYDGVLRSDVDGLLYRVDEIEEKVVE